MSSEAQSYLKSTTSDPRWGSVATFYLEGLDLITSELEEARQHSPDTLIRLDTLAADLATMPSDIGLHDLYEDFSSAFFPQGVGITGNEDRSRDELRERRTVTIEALTDNPLVDPGTQLLLTTNALFTVPDSKQPQRYWYDHPVPFGVPDSQNEIIYGLRGMEKAITFEKNRGTMDSSIVIPVVMSASSTHGGSSALIHDHVRDLLQRSGGLHHLDVYVFTEADARRLVDETLAPAVARFLPDRNPELLDAIGVDGRYGRHYSFLKAIAGWWNVMIDPSVIGTYKFDLDQVFPQDVLVGETGLSAWEHLANPLWGAQATDANGRPVELGMMAGSLVNASDIESSIFTLDVTYPKDNPTIDEMLFWSALPQALSTAAEMGTRYRDLEIDGITSAVERVHVTGGTTAIRLDALRRHRPFTPGFIARAEDQAYLMSVHSTDGTRLACLHNDGLIMRHDKEAFASDAIRAAAIGKLIGDYERMILFSAYAREVAANLEDLKSHFDPFTGCFVSRLPITATYLRFTFRSLRFFAQDEPRDGAAFVEQGAPRITEAIRFVSGSTSSLAQQLGDERAAWELFFDVLDAVEAAIAGGDEFAYGLVENARALLNDVAARSPG
jgi:hypothetical protein